MRKGAMNAVALARCADLADTDCVSVLAGHGPCLLPVPDS